MNKFLRISFVAALLAVFGYSHATDVKFDFIANGLSMFEGITAASDSESTAGDITSDVTTTLNGVTMTISPSTDGKNINRLWSWTENEVAGAQLRIYSGTITLTSSEPMTKIVFEQPSKSTKWTDPSPSTGTLSGQEWTGSATELVFTFSAQCRINSITVTTDANGGTVDPPTPQPEGTVFDFDNNADDLFPSMAGKRSSGSNDSYVADGEFMETLTSTAVNGATVTVEASPEDAKTRNRLWATSPVLRMYNSTLTIKAEENIKSITFHTGWNNSKLTWNTGNTASVGTLTLGDQDNKVVTWTGDAKEVVITIAANTQIKKIELGFDEVTPPDPPQPGNETLFDFDNKADELFPSMAGKRSSGSNDSYVADGEFTETLTSTAVNGATVTVEASPEDAKTKNRLWATSPVLRMYNGTLTVNAAENIKTMTITVGWNSNNKVLTWNTGNTVSTGTLTFGDQSNQTVTWKGNAKEVVFTIAANTQIKKIELGFEEQAPELVISGVTPFEGSTTVTITGGDNIYYTIDGSDPKTNMDAPLYSGPFTLTETATVKAWDELLDISAEKTFTKKETPVVNSIAEFIALQKGDKAVLNLNGAVCLFTWTSNATPPNTMAYVRDNSGALNFFNTGIEMNTGDVLDGSIILQKDEYNGLPEAIKAGDMTSYDNLLISAGTSQPEPRSIVIKDVDKYVNDLVELQNVSITTEAGTEPGGGGGGGGDTPAGDIVFDFNNNADTLFPSMAGKRSSGTGATYDPSGEFTETLTSTAVSGATVTVEASPTDAGTKNRLWSTAPVLRMYNGTLTITGPSGKNITGITFNLASAPSSSRWGNNNSVDSGTLAPEGEKDKKTNTVTWSGSANQVVLTIAANTQIGSISLALDGAASAPKRADAVKYYAKDDGGNTVQIYNNYHIAAFDDYSTFVNDKKYNVKGIVTVYKTSYEINTLEINETTTGINAVESDRLDVNAPIYNLAGQQVNKSFKGVVIQNGKKYISK